MPFHALIVAVGFAVACSSPVGVSRVPARQVHRSLTANVLTTGSPSVLSIQALNRRNLSALHRRDPDAALHRLRRAMLIADDRSDLVFVLAEVFRVGAELERKESA